MPSFNDKKKKRAYLAYLAAKIILDSEEISFKLAKKKAAKQANLLKKTLLPSDDEIRFHLQSQRSMFKNENEKDKIQATDLIELLLLIMEPFLEFNISLTGPMVNGKENPSKEINFHAYTDDQKKLEYLLIDRDYKFSIADRKFWFGGCIRQIPTYIVESDVLSFNISTFPGKTIRQKIKKNPNGEFILIAGFEKLKYMSNKQS
tara:strand:+ start:232 stop:843 length:612 start_codon:yes stop_codon:yes gene_type:complete